MNIINLVTIINLTPHKIVIYDEDPNKVAEIAPSGNVARIATSKVKVRSISGLPIFKTTIGKPEGLPDRRPNTIYIVSGMFRSHVQREDIYQPGELLRDDSGQPIGCIGLSQ